MVAGAAALIVLVWGLKILSLSFKRAPKQDRASVSVQHTENGSVRISVAAPYVQRPPGFGWRTTF